MTTAIRGLSPGFGNAVGESLAVLAVTSRCLKGMCASAANLLDENDLHYMLSLSQTAEQRGLRLVDEFPEQVRDVEAGDLADQLAATHEVLIENSSARDDFAVLEFVSEVGALCRGVRRYVEHH